MKDSSRPELYRQVVYLTLGCLLSYLATMTVNQIFHLGGPFDRLERLNPLFVQEFQDIPSTAQKYLHWQSLDFGEGATLVIRGNEFTLEDIKGKRPGKISHGFLKQAPSTGYRVFVEKIFGRGFVRIVQQPMQDNDYAAKIKIEDPYGAGSEYRLNLYFQSIDSDR